MKVRTGAHVCAPADVVAFTLRREDFRNDPVKVQELRRYCAGGRLQPARHDRVDFVDMRMKRALGMPTYDQFTAVIVRTITHPVIGMVVEIVSDIVTMRTGDVRPAPHRGTRHATA